MRVKRLQPEVSTGEMHKAVDLSLVAPVIKKYKGKKGNIIPLLQGTQNLFGYIPREAFIMISEEAGIPLNELYGVATFYAQFRLKPVGKHIVKVCHGTACHVQNATAVSVALEEALGVNDGETTPDGLFTLESVACLGCCSLAPVMMIGNDTFGKLTGKSAVNIIKEIKMKEKN